MEESHPIEGLMLTAMNSIKQMVDVNTIIGDPIQALNNTVIIPISKVGFGFAAGGSEFNGETVNVYNKKEKEENIKYRLPFGGGSGAGVSITPVAFLIIQNNNVKLIEAKHENILDKLVEYVPDVINKISDIFKSKDIEDEEFDDDLEYDYDDFEDVEYNDEKEHNKNDYEEDEDILTEKVLQENKQSKEGSTVKEKKKVEKNLKHGNKKVEKKVEEINIDEEYDDE